MRTIAKLRDLLGRLWTRLHEAATVRILIQTRIQIVRIVLFDSYCCLITDENILCKLCFVAVKQQKIYFLSFYNFYSIA